MGSPYETAETLRLFAIGDLHLPGGQGKPMDVFGDQWQDHFRHIEQDWRARVREQGRGAHPRGYQLGPVPR